jgi:hypothetical protein
MLSKDMILASFSLIWRVKFLLLASLASALKILIPPLFLFMFLYSNAQLPLLTKLISMLDE